MDTHLSADTSPVQCSLVMLLVFYRIINAVAPLSITNFKQSQSFDQVKTPRIRIFNQESISPTFHNLHLRRLSFEQKLKKAAHKMLVKLIPEYVLCNKSLFGQKTSTMFHFQIFKLFGRVYTSMGNLTK
jgi:hypothetical protein